MRPPLGQHFLRDPRILDRIVDALEPTPEDVVIEIGPGEGTLTRRLAPRVGAVLAIEKDRRLACRLRDAAVGDEPLPENVSVVEGDVLELDWRAQPPLTARRSPLTVKVAGNIPYYITSPLLERSLTPPLPTVIVFLVQKEVADRVVSPPGSKVYGALSVGIQTVAEVERLFTVKAGAFRPPPAVDSAVVRLRPRTAPLVHDDERPALRRLVTGLFGRRRKQLARSLRDVAGLSKDEAARVLGGLRIDPATRPESLPPERFVELLRALPR